ncbi:S8 family serine peptidase [Streptomyces sp. TRM66268-LWL]|uniref:S8 family serine peptidase n=1 Tax=Streptomyces polyasparticus TaxID=2767826 RepID=A0ABR7SU90_9ACTN|nr:S8 family serine peptidase [Streptomyces polyasparticus]MBC9719040.1 S8 family serine peptidase [Streptomyces polyasparticus]
MPSTLLVQLTTDAEAETGAVRATGAEVLARYPDALLVRADAEQAVRIGELATVTELQQPAVVTAGNTFTFADAVEAQHTEALEPPPGRTAYYLLRLAGPPAPEWLAELAARGVRVHDSLAGFTLVIGVLPEHAEQLTELPWAEEVTPYRPAMKVSPKVYPADERPTALAHPAPAQEQLVEVSVFPGESVEDVAAVLRTQGGAILSTSGRTLVASAVPSRVAELPGVQAVLPYALAEYHNDRARRVLGVAEDNSAGGIELGGAGQIVAVADSGLDTGDIATLHEDVRGRVTGLVSWPVRSALAPYVDDPPGSDDGPADGDNGHGTHVTGSVLGDGAAALAAHASPVPAGTAPEAQVFFQSIGQRVHWKTEAEVAHLPRISETWPPPASGLYGLPDDLRPLFEQAHRAGARIHTNSWGAPTAGLYTAKSRAVDDFVWNHPDMLILFSAGNEGEDRDGNGVVDEDSIGSPATAKNCLTIGAGENDRPADSAPAPGRNTTWDRFTRAGVLRYPKMAAAGHISDDVDGLAAFSSRGPTDDGRIKPDLIAPGTNVLSLLSRALPPNAVPLWGKLPVGHPLRSAYCWSGGTSMSTPLTAGAAALVREYLVRERRHHPTAALLKAFLVNGAAAMPGQFAGEIAPGPNNASGFGRVDVTGSVGTDGRHRALFADDFQDAVQTGARVTYRLEDLDPGRPLKITLAWTDAPSEAAGGLVNKLYLQVRRADGSAVHDGDVRPFPGAVNNVQQVTIEEPGTDPYLIDVWGVMVTRRSLRAVFSAIAHQDFAVVASNGLSLRRI